MFTTYAQKQAPAQKSTVSNAATVDDRRSLPVAQRVVQRAGGVVQRAPADGKFVYYPDISGDVYKDRVPYEGGKICFTPYNGGEVKSASFSGCFMMAFKFKDPGNTQHSDYFQLLDKDSAPYPLSLRKTYIAHVATATGDSVDAKKALFDAENRGLIKIEAMFKPYRNSEDDYSVEKLKDRREMNVLKGASGLKDVTGSLIQDEKGEWSSKVYTQERVLKDGWDKIDDGKYKDIPSVIVSERPDLFEWKTSERLDRRMDANRLKFETESTKAFWYASIAVTATSDLKEKAYKELKKISPMALQNAIEHLSTNKDANALMESLLESPSASEGVSSGSGSDKAVIL